MKRWLVIGIWLLALLGVSVCVHAQRKSLRKIPGEPAKIIFRQDFEKQGITDFDATGYGSVKFLKARMPESEALAKVEGFTVKWKPAGVSGSKGMLEIASTGNSGGSAEKYMEWPAEDVTIMFTYYSHGVNSAYVQGWANKADRNLHAYLKIDRQDSWEVFRVKAESMVGFGGGFCSTDEKFGNLMFHVSEFDVSVENPYFLIDNIILFRGRDGQPPTKGPASLAVSFDNEKEAVVLTWEAAVDDVGIAVYKVYRSETPDFKVDRRRRIGSVVDNSFADPTAAAGETYYYKVVASDAGGYEIASDEVKYKVEQGAAHKTDDEQEF